MSYHKVFIVGNLGRDPEMRYTPSGQPVTNISVATTDSWNKDGEKHERTIWWRVAIFGKAAEACNEYLKKGSKVLVEGRMNADDKGNPRMFKRGDGSSGTSFEMTALTVKFLSSANSHAASDGDSDGDAAPAADAPADEEFPF